MDVSYHLFHNIVIVVDIFFSIGSICAHSVINLKADDCTEVYLLLNFYLNLVNYHHKHRFSRIKFGGKKLLTTADACDTSFPEFILCKYFSSTATP